jgi:uncharacterized membrane protein YdjX (TVP38/TMEM64 family)
MHMNTSSEGAERMPKAVVRIGLLVVLLVVIWAVGLATGVHEQLDPETWRQTIANAGAGGVFVFVALFCLAQLGQVTGHPLIAAAVFAWGWFPGALLSILAATVAAVLNFGFTRAVGGDVREVRSERLQRVLSRLDAAPIRTIVVARIIFMTAPPLANSLALSGVRHRDHAVGTLLGLVPSVLFTAYVWAFGLEWLGVLR